MTDLGYRVQSLTTVHCDSPYSDFQKKANQLTHSQRIGSGALRSPAAFTMNTSDPTQLMADCQGGNQTALCHLHSLAHHQQWDHNNKCCLMTHFTRGA